MDAPDKPIDSSFLKRATRRVRTSLAKGAKFAWKEVGIPLVILHAASNIVHYSIQGWNDLFPSEERIEIQEELGFPVRGYEEGIGSNPHRVLFWLNNELQREQYERPTPITSFNISSENYWQKDIKNQIGSLLFDYCAYANPLTNSIVSIGNQGTKTFVHEAKHIKTYDIEKTNPELIARWGSISQDAEGNSFYSDPSESIFSLRDVFMHMNIIGKLVSKGELPESTLTQLGFVSPYARTDIYEDIAELCADVESNPQSVDNSIVLRKSGRILNKVKLAQEYNLIPPEFLEYANVNDEYTKYDLCEFSFYDEACPFWNNGMTFSQYMTHLKDMQKQSKEVFMKSSAAFLAEHPNSIYACKVHVERGEAIAGHHFFGSQDPYPQEAVQEFKKALLVPFKEIESYVSSLNNLRKHVEIDEHKSGADNPYQVALEEYQHREYDLFDKQLQFRGVNDLLRELDAL